MAVEVLHSESGLVTALKGIKVLGTEGGVPKSYDFGTGRSAAFRLKVEVNAVIPVGAPTGFQLGIEFGEDDISFPSGSLVDLPTLVNAAAPSVIQYISVKNESWLNADLLQTRRYVRCFWTATALFAGDIDFDAIVTLFDGTDLVVQTAPVPTPGANVYASITDLLAVMAGWSCIPATFFPLLPPGRQEDIWTGATRRIETEVRSLCPPQPSGSAPVNPDTQRLVWPRQGAHGLDGLLITSWLPSWVEGIAHYAEEMARAEAVGSAVHEPGETQGMTSIQLGPENADFRGQWADGKSGSFFAAPGRAKIWNLLSESFQSRSRG